MLALADWLFTLLHLLITLFNLIGWVSRATRRVHRWCVAITAFCWIVPGALMGTIGWCPLTEWHWDIKKARGEENIPASFITYMLNRAGFFPDPQRVDAVVGAAFVLIVLMTIFLWMRDRKNSVKKSQKSAELPVPRRVGKA